MKHLDIIATLFLIAGAINWGLVGLFEFNLIDYVFGQTWIDRLLYVAMGFSALFKIFNWKGIVARWK